MLRTSRLPLVKVIQFLSFCSIWLWFEAKIAAQLSAMGMWKALKWPTLKKLSDFFPEHIHPHICRFFWNQFWLSHKTFSFLYWWRAWKQWNEISFSSHLQSLKCCCPPHKAFSYCSWQLFWRPLQEENWLTFHIALHKDSSCCFPFCAQYMN